MMSDGSNHLSVGSYVCQHTPLILLWVIALSAIVTTYVEDISWVRIPLHGNFTNRLGGGNPASLDELDEGGPCPLNALMNNENKNSSLDELDGVDGSCPLDALLHDKHCQTGFKNTYCVLPDFIIKKVKRKEYWYREVRMYELLNDTRYYPKLIHRSDECMTILIENVRPRGKDKDMNEWTADFSFYKNFYKGAFEIFNEKGIHPYDLNVCCNTVVNGKHIRIIDFDLYQEVTNTSKLTKMNNDLLSKLLLDVKKLTQKYSMKQKSSKEHNKGR